MKVLHKYYGLVLRIGVGAGLVAGGMTWLRGAGPAELAARIHPALLTAFGSAPLAPLVGLAALALGLLLLLGAFTNVTGPLAALFLLGAVLVSPEAPAGLRMHATLAAAGIAASLALFGGGTHAVDSLMADRTTMTNRAMLQTLLGLAIAALGAVLLGWLPALTPLGRLWGTLTAGAVLIGGLVVLWLQNPICSCVTERPVREDAGLLLLRLSLAYTLLVAAAFPAWGAVSLPRAAAWAAAILLGIGILSRLTALGVLSVLVPALLSSGAGNPLPILGAGAALVVLGGAGRYSLLTPIARALRKAKAPAGTAA